MNEGPVVITVHIATFAGIATILGLLLREHKVWIRMKDRMNQLWKDRCHAKSDDYVPLENGNHQMWTYRVTEGGMYRPDTTLLCFGYSGKGAFKNDPESEAVHNRGPIPRGRYFIGDPRDTVTHGPYVLPLTPAPDNIMYGRDGFLIHGDSVTDPGNASEGCIVLAHQFRVAISISGDYDLCVVDE